MAGIMEAGKIAYFQRQYVPIEEARVSVLTHSFNYGTALFEGIRGYYCPDEDNIFIFRLKEHIDRLVRNFKIMLIELPESEADLNEICVEVVRRSGFRQGAYIRPIAYKSAEILEPMLHGVEASFCCYAIKLGDYVNIDDGLDIAMTSWRRSGDNAIPSRAKTAGGYINSSLAATEAKMAGFHEAIFLREDGTVAEGSAMNLFLVQDGKLVTPPPTADILVGVTRNTIIQMAREMFGLEVIERAVSRTELYVCDEVFFTGTGAQVAPVRSLDRRPIGSGKPGPVTLELQKAYFDVVRGKVDAYRHWCTPVY